MQQNQDHGGQRWQSFGGGDHRTVSTITSNDSIPLGCDAGDYYEIKYSRAVRQRIGASNGAMSSASRQPNTIPENMPTLKHLPCSRFFLDASTDNPEMVDMLCMMHASHSAGLPYDPYNNAQNVDNLAGQVPRRLATLRTRDSIVISDTFSRPFTVDVTKAMTLLIGVNSEAPLPMSRPTRFENMCLVPVQVQQGQRVEMHCKGAIQGSIQMEGEIQVFLNGEFVAGKEHGLSRELCGIVMWMGSLSDLIWVDKKVNAEPQQQQQRYG